MYLLFFFSKLTSVKIKISFDNVYCLGNALLRRLVRIGVLDETRMKLDYVLGLKVEDFMERRLQTQVC